MEAEFALKTEVRGDVLIMATSGYVNNDGGQQIASVFEEYHAKGFSRVVMDMKESKVVNSIGISFLIEVIEKLNDNNGKLIFANLAPSIEKTLSIMGLFNYAAKESSVDKALAALA